MCHSSAGNWRLLGEFPDHEPLIAYRTWLVIDDELTSWWKNPRFIWTQEMVATCAHGEHAAAAPQIDCSCGLHAFSKQVELDQFAHPSRRGVVALSGRVLVSDSQYGGQVYRAQRAKIVETEDRLIASKWE